MKSIEVLLLLLVSLLIFVSCQNPQNQVQIETNKTGGIADGGTTTQVKTEITENDFCLTLYADNSVYSTDEVIKIWATLEYVGDEDSVTIWHGDPYIVFSVTDGANFNVDGFVHDILESTELKKGEQYRFDYIKSGGYDASAPDADFWKKFYQEEDLKLPAGAYTISVGGAFYLSNPILSAQKGPTCELQITVE